MKKIKKIYLKKEKWNEEEKKTGKASYATLINSCVYNMILCNEIADDIWNDLELYNGDLCYYIDDKGEYRTQEEYENDETGTIHEEYEDIYQYYIIGSNDAERLAEISDEIIFYINRLNLYVLGVTHFGTSWMYVPTDIELTDDFEDYWNSRKGN